MNMVFYRYPDLVLSAITVVIQSLTDIMYFLKDKDEILSIFFSFFLLV